MTDTDELVKRLRLLWPTGIPLLLVQEAADTIESLQARIAELEKALFISNESGKQLGRLVREKDDDRVFFRDRCKELEAQIAARGEPVGEVIDPTFVRFYANKQLPYGTKLYLGAPAVPAVPDGMVPCKVQGRARIKLKDSFGHDGFVKTLEHNTEIYLPAAPKGTT